jgi:hypothetical protein
MQPPFLFWLGHAGATPGYHPSVSGPTRSDDIIGAFVRRVRDAHLDIPVDTLVMMEMQLRDEYGGKCVYVSRSERSESTRSEDRVRG